MQSTLSWFLPLAFTAAIVSNAGPSMLLSSASSRIQGAQQAIAALPDVAAAPKNAEETA